MEIPRQKGVPLKAACLLYHDVVENADWESSGFTGPGTARYKLNRKEFESHLACIAAVRNTSACTVRDLVYSTNPAGALPFLLTFDDGGSSAAGCIAGLLEKYGWRGHFFVTAGQIGNKGFMNAAQICGLKKSGHVIGSHSFSHPLRMSHCSREELTNEWTHSIEILSAILGEQIDTASVPGGYYSDRVGEAAADSGIRVLFNSEPTTTIRSIRGCMIVGRYNIFRGTPASVSGELVSLRPHQRSRQWMYWNFKKVAKKIAGRPYLAVRQILLRKG